MRIKPAVLVFDLDDTLFPEWQFVQSGFRAAAVWLASEFSDLASDEVYRRLVELHTNGNRGVVFDLLLVELGIDSTLLHKLITLYRFHSPQGLSLHLDAVQLLDDLVMQGQHAALGLITNGFAQAQRNKVAALGIEKSFDVLVYCEELGPDSYKPSSIPYLKLMQELHHLDLRPDQFLYVGDHAQKDFVGAKAVGWQTVRILREDGVHAHVVASQEQQADRTITTLTDLLLFDGYLATSHLCEARQS